MGYGETRSIVSMVRLGGAFVLAVAACSTPPRSGVPDAVTRLSALVPQCLSSATAHDVGHFSCAVCGNGDALCWKPARENADEVETEVRLTRDAVDVVVGGNYGCALTADGALDCAELDDSFDAAFNVRRQAQPGWVVLLVHATDDPCAIMRDGTLRCWGSHTQRRDLPIDRRGSVPIVDAFGSARYGCALVGGSFECWDDRGARHDRVRVGLDDAVAIDGLVRYEHVFDGPPSESLVFCSVMANGHVACAEDARGPYVEIPGVTRATDVEVYLARPELQPSCRRSLEREQIHGCAVIEDGSVVCWGWRREPQWTRLPDSETKVCNDVGDDGRYVAHSQPIEDAIALTWLGERLCAKHRAGAPTCWAPARTKEARR
jgi:hypothetical protein